MNAKAATTTASPEVADVESQELVQTAGFDAAAADVAHRVAGLTTGSVGAVASTFTEDNFAARKALYTAMNDAEPVADHLNETFGLVHIVAQAIEITDTDTGVISPAVRTTLVTADGKSFAAVSDQLYRSVQGILNILGQPSEWTEPVNVQVVEKRSKIGRRFYSISLV